MSRGIEEVISRAIGVDGRTLGSRSIELAAAARAKARHVTLEQYAAMVTEPRELQALIELVVVPETWFVRVPAAFRLLARLATAPAAPTPFRILTFPCSSGEEPYSVAITLLEAGRSCSSFSIDAADVSTRAIDRARARTYGRSSFRNRPESFNRQYFEPAGSARWVLTAERVWTSVRFRQANLTDPSTWPGGEPYHAIFCRNVLIYLHRQVQQRVLATLRSRLAPDGVLFLGEGEGGLALAEGWRHISGASDAFAFRFESGTGLHEPRLRVRTPPVRSAPPAPPPIRLRPPPPSPSPGREPQTTSDDALLAEAQQLADAGELSRAEQLCRQYLTTHTATADAYHLLGLLREAGGEIAEAAALYRKALYLDPNHTETMRHIALILDGRGGARRAERLRKLAAAKDGER